MDSKTRRLNAYFSYAVSFVMSLLSGAFTPIVPLLGLSLGASQIELGLIGSAAFLVYIPTSFIAGSLSDRIGRKSLIAASALVYALACVFYHFSSSPLHLIGARIVDGFSMALLWPVLEALLGESALLEPREMVSNFGVSWSFGAAMGALVSSWFIGARRYVDVFLPGAVISIVSCLLTLLLISDRSGGTSDENRSTLESEEAGLAELRPVWMVAFLYAFCQGMVFALYPPYAELIGVPGIVIGLAVTFLMTGRTLVFLLFRRFKGDFRTLAAAGSALISISTLPLSWGTSPGMILPSSLVFGLGSGLAYAASIRVALSMHGPARGKYAGFFEGSIGAGYLIGPAIGGSIAQFALQGPYFVCVVASLIALLSIARYGPKSQ